MDWLSLSFQRFWNGIKDKFAAKTHSHTKSEITDFPTSMPASDVSSWAKASTKPTYTASEVGAANSSHNHDVVSTSANGFCPKRNGSATSYLNGNGTWTVPDKGQDCVVATTEPSSQKVNDEWLLKY